MRRKDYLNLLTFARIYLFLQLFSMPIVYTFFSNTELFETLNDLKLQPFTSASLSISILGYIFFYFGGMLNISIIKKHGNEMDWSKKWVETAFWGLFIFGFLFKFGRIITESSLQVSSAKIGLLDNELITFFLSLNWFHLLALPFLGIYYFENRDKKASECTPPGHYYLWILAFYLINGALNGATSFVIFPLTIHLAIYQHYNCLKRRHFLFGFFLLSFIIFLKIAIKNVILDDPRSVTSFLSPIWFLIYRIGASFVISAIVENPVFDYGYGLFEQFMYNFNVPGFDYAIPDGNLLGRFYGIIHHNDYATGIAVTGLGDFYLNFGTLGVVFGMFVLGILYRVISNFSLTKNKLLLVIYAMLWPIMIHGLESPITVLISACIKMILFCIFIYFIFKTIVMINNSE